MESTVRTTMDADKIVTVWLDSRWTSGHKAKNTVTAGMLFELAEAVDSLERDPTVKGVIFASGHDDSFLVGADLFELREMGDKEREQFLVRGQELFERIARLKAPTVAAINGDCLGGGLELALACRYRLVADESRISLGLPELRLGILPAWGGTVRLPRLIGIPRALQMILMSESLPPSRAVSAGLVDEEVRPEALLAAAKRKLLSGDRPHRPSMIHRVLASVRWVRERIFATARQRTLEKTAGHYPAAEQMIDAMRRGFDEGPAVGLQAERSAVISLMGTQTCRNLMRIFFLRHEGKRWTSERIPDKPVEVKEAAVIGGGTMGSGIVHALIRAGIRVRLIEASHEAMAAALGRIRTRLDEEVADRRLTELEARHTFNRVVPSVEWTGLRLADFVVEAVAERLEVKKEVFARLARLTRPDAILATNTSSLRVDELADVVSAPTRVVGLHFFNPVHKMPLVEVVAGPRSGGQALATATQLVDRIGKVAVVVKDEPGFVVNRILVPYLSEAVVMAVEGTDIRLIDQTMNRWGMVMGPFDLLDGVGLDIVAEVMNSLREDDPFVAYTHSVLRPSSMDRVVKQGWLGRKSGRGFYLYQGHSRHKRNPPIHTPVLAEFIGSPPPGASQPPPPLDPATQTMIEERLVLPMINEGTRLLSRSVIDRPDALDLATIFGIGFAPFRGGLIRWADSLGTKRIAQRLDELSKQHGPRFSPTPLLRQFAETNKPLSEYEAAVPLPKPRPAARAEVAQAFRAPDA